MNLDILEEAGSLDQFIANFKVTEGTIPMSELVLKIVPIVLRINLKVFDVDPLEGLRNSADLKKTLHQTQDYQTNLNTLLVTSKDNLNFHSDTIYLLKIN